MPSKLIGIKINVGTMNAELYQVLRYLKETSRKVNAHLQQLNPTTVSEEAQKAASLAMQRAHIRVQGESLKIVNGFFVTETKAAGDKNLTLKHKYFSKYNPTITRKSSLRPFKISGRSLYTILDTGRKRYEIVKKENKSSRFSPLKFYWGKMSRWVTFYWKGPRGGRKRFIVVNPKSNVVDFNTGSRFTDAAFEAINKMVEARRKKIEAIIV